MKGLSVSSTMALQGDMEAYIEEFDMSRFCMDGKIVFMSPWSRIYLLLGPIG